MLAGGPVATALAQVRRFGVPSRLLGSWGSDFRGEFIERDLKRHEIQFDSVACRNASRTGFAHVWIESTTGQRTIVSVRPDGEPAVPDALQLAASASLLHLDGWGGEAAVAAAQAITKAGGLVTLDCGSMKAATERILPLAHLVNVPMRFLRSTFGTNDAAVGARMVRQRSSQIVTVTDGERGAGIFTEADAFWLPAYRVAAIDTCGAGDVFCGGLIYACLAEMTPLDALRFAMGTAAIKVSRQGNRDALATKEEIIAFLRNRNDI